MPAAMMNALSARASCRPTGSRQLLTCPPARVCRPRAAPGARADAFGGVSRFFAATPRRGEPDGDDVPTRGYPAQVAVAFAADTAAFTAQSSAIEAELGLEPFSNSASAAIAAMMQLAEAEVAAKAGAVPDARDTAQRRAQALREAVELATARASDVNTRILDENQARAEAMMRGFADLDASGVIERLRTAAEQSAEEVTRSAFGGGAPLLRRAVITHAVAANERSSVTLQVPEWKASERDAANALAAEFRAPQTVAEIAEADAPEGRAGRGGFKRGQRQFKPLFKDYPYETADKV